MRQLGLLVKQKISGPTSDACAGKTLKNRGDPLRSQRVALAEALPEIHLFFTNGLRGMSLPWRAERTLFEPPAGLKSAGRRGRIFGFRIHRHGRPQNSFGFGGPIEIARRHARPSYSKSAPLRHGREEGRFG